MKKSILAIISLIIFGSVFSEEYIFPSNLSFQESHIDYNYITRTCEILLKPNSDEPIVAFVSQESKDWPQSPEECSRIGNQEEPAILVALNIRREERPFYAMARYMDADKYHYYDFFSPSYTSEYVGDVTSPGNKWVFYGNFYDCSNPSYGQINPSLCKMFMNVDIFGTAHYSLKK